MQAWWNNFWKAALGIIAFLGSIASIAALFGSFDLSVLYTFLALGVIFIGVAAVLTKPPSKKSVAKILNQAFEISDIENYVGFDQKVGLIGLRDVGKTTFLENVSNQMLSNRGTISPYAVPVAHPINGKQRCRLIIDSVGQSMPNQLAIAELSDSIIFFVDHNDAPVNHVSPERFEGHKSFIENFVSALRQKGKKFTNCTMVFNKFDLWSHSRPEYLQQYYDALFRILQESGIAKNFNMAVDHSNNDRNKVVRLLGLAFERPYEVKEHD